MHVAQYKTTVIVRIRGLDQICLGDGRFGRFFKCQTGLFWIQLIKYKFCMYYNIITH